MSKVKLVWTKSNLPLSWAIRWCLDEPVSHFAIVFDDKIVFHSNLLGTHVKWLATFKKSAKIVFQLEYEMNLDQQEALYQECIKRDGAPYDFVAFFKLAYYGLRRKWFGIPLPLMPDDLAWAYLCTDLAIALPADIVGNFKGLQTLTPMDLFKRIEAINDSKK